MNCEEIAELLSEYLQRNLADAQSANVEQHLLECAECRDDVAIWQKLSVLPTEQPNPDARARFDAMLQAYKTGRDAHAAPSSRTATRVSFWDAFRWLRSPAGAAAWSFALLVLGVFIGTRVNAQRGPNPNTPATEQEMTAMHDELANMRQMVALSMLQQQSASGRLEGVTWTRREEHLDAQVLSALLHTLRYDPSVDVRLAALDALSRHSAQPQIRSSIVDSLQAQQSPLVQVALIDQLVQWRDRKAAPRLEQLRQDPKLNPTVRERADWAIRQLN